MAPLSKELTNQQLVEHLEAEVARGRMASVATVLRQTDLRAIPDSLILRFAHLARRAGLPVQSLRILSRKVHWNSGKVAGSDEERSAYSASLIRLGALPEALRMLATVDPNKVLDVLLYRAFAQFAVWEYADAIPLLEQYVEKSQRDGHSSKALVGRMNLAAAFVHERQTERATTLLAELRASTKEHGLVSQYGNCLEISAQLAIATKSWEAAKGWLNDAYQALRLKGGSDLFFVSKWRGILELEEKKDAASIQNISELKKEAAQLGLWENVRDLDLALVSAVNDEATFSHLYFGTPGEGFRKHLFRSTRKTFPLPDFYDWNVGPTFQVVDISKLSIRNQSRRLLSLLCRDFYRPLRVTDIFSVLHSEEYFNPFTSAGRIHQTVRMLRKELAKLRVALPISFRGVGYRILPPAGVSIRVSRQKDSQSILQSLAHLEDKPFTSKEAAQRLKLPLRTIQRRLKTEVEKGHLETTGRSQNSRYSFRKR